MAKIALILKMVGKKNVYDPEYLEHIGNKTSTDHIFILVRNSFDLTYRCCARTWTANTGLTLPISYDSGRKSKYIVGKQTRPFQSHICLNSTLYTLYGIYCSEIFK